ncbi:MAG: phosphoglycolate phosphatase [Halomonadaceae bacterium]|nr:MAG: phosphoglycolate phosphatase [Halomonadaceae bacterium]
MSLQHPKWPTVILLDLDGTLVDSVPDLATAVDTMLSSLERPPAGLAQVRRWVGDGATRLIERALADQDEPTTAPDAELFNRAKTAFYSAYHQCNGQQSQLYPGVLPFLRGAREQGCALAVVTNKPETFTLPLLRQLDLAHFFAAVISGDSLTRADGSPLRKPDPEPLQAAMEKLHGDRDNSIMIGDSRADIAAARGVGIPVIAVSYGYNHGEPIAKYQPDRVVDSLESLLAEETWHS